MTIERLDRSLARVAALVETPPDADRDRTASAEPGGKIARELVTSMLLARELDRAALMLRAAGVGHYTITSAGHEANAVLGHLTHPTDPALVHYRSAAFVLERARARPELDLVRDLVRSLVASSDDPIAGGRHKVFGRRELGIIPQTSTIASHLPRALGLAFALGRGDTELPPDALVLASFGEAGVNHSTWLGAVNAAGWLDASGVELPLLLVCEDNGLGVSVRAPAGFTEARLRALPGVTYFAARGSDLDATWAAASAAVGYCRGERRPAVLHLHLERLLPHAGSDVDLVYRTSDELARAEAEDPLWGYVHTALARGWLAPKELAGLLAECRARVTQTLTEEGAPRRWTSVAELAQPLHGRVSPAVLALPRGTPSDAPHTLAEGIRAALTEALAANPSTLVFGEDVGVKGGAYGVTRGLQARFGARRVFDTLLDEQTILGLALGTATLGALPVPEIQYLAFLHNAEDQLRGEAMLLPFLSNGAYDNPMVVRIAAFADPNGPGGPFHNDTSLAVLRDVPGLVVAVPARADDARALYRTAFALAVQAGRVVVVLEPLALYHARDLEAPADGAWLAADDGSSAAWGRGRSYGPAAHDLVIASYGTGVHTALRAAGALARDAGLIARVFDLRWVHPLPLEHLCAEVAPSGRLLVLEEARASGGVAEAVAAAIAERSPTVRWSRVTGADCPVPLGPAAALVLPTLSDVVARARALVGR